MIDPNSETTSLLRHFGSVIAGILISRGVITSGYTETVIGAVVALGMIGLAWWNKYTAKKTKADTVAVALTLPSNTRNDTLNTALADENLPPVDLGKA